MSARSPLPLQQIKQNETDIAVLQVQFTNLDEKVDDLKTSLKDMATEMKAQHIETQNLIKGFQVDNVTAHKEMSDKISKLEKWRWMLMGAGVLLGSVIVPLIDRLIKIQH